MNEPAPGGRHRRIRVPLPRLIPATVVVVLLLFAASYLVQRRHASSSPGVPSDSTVSTSAGDPVCLQGSPFVAQGPVSVATTPPGGATRISSLRWERHDGCERFVIDLDADGQDTASSGQVSVELLRHLGVVRVTVAGVRTVAPEATDASFAGPLARRAYAIWAPDGRSTYVDLHLAQPAEAHATVLEDPARIVVDLRPGGGALAEPPAAGQRVVVLEPRPGEAAYPLRVVGYARTFEANVVGRLEQNGQAARDTFTTATSWADAWGHFTFTLPDGPAGPVTLHVGEHSARDGTWEGVRVELLMR